MSDFDNIVEAEVSKLPDCDICKYDDGVTTTAAYDGKTKQGPWAFMCEAHFNSHGVGLGTGTGQLLKVGK